MPHSAPVVTNRDVQPTTGLLKSLADDTRLRIVALLSHGELCVCHIAAALELSQPNASQHLTVLKNAGLVDRERRGSWIYYRISPQDPARERVVRAVLDACLGDTGADDRRLEIAKAAERCE